MFLPANLALTAISNWSGSFTETRTSEWGLNLNSINMTNKLPFGEGKTMSKDSYLRIFPKPKVVYCLCYHFLPQWLAIFGTAFQTNVWISSSVFEEITAFCDSIARRGLLAASGRQPLLVAREWRLHGHVSRSLQSRTRGNIRPAVNKHKIYRNTFKLTRIDSAALSEWSGGEWTKSGVGSIEGIDFVFEN